MCSCYCFFFFFSSRRRHTRLQGDWSSDVCSSDLCGFSRRNSRPPETADGSLRRLCPASCSAGRSPSMPGHETGSAPPESGPIRCRRTPVLAITRTEFCDTSPCGSPQGLSYSGSIHPAKRPLPGRRLWSVHGASGSGRPSSTYLLAACCSVYRFLPTGQGWTLGEWTDTDCDRRPNGSKAGLSATILQARSLGTLRLGGSNRKSLKEKMDY